ncbi:MAG: sialidase family protein [Opitutaceae bacterium]
MNPGPESLRSGSRPLSPRARLTGILLALGAVAFVLIRGGGRESGPPAGIEAPPPTLTGAGWSDAVPHFAHGWVSPPAHTPSAHGSSLCALPSGDLLAIWYGGSREGGSDVCLYTSRLPATGGGWTPPRMEMDRLMAQQELDRVIKKVGNAVVFPDLRGLLWMVYVSVSVGGWSGSALNVRTSSDEGLTWSPSERLTLNPFLNLSTLVRNKPIFARDGRIGLPVYHEMAAKFPQILWLTPGGDGRLADYRVRNLPGQAGLIQPALVPLDENRVLMLLRDRSADRLMHLSLSQDAGWTWSDARHTDLPNPDAALDGLRLRDGRILIVYNHATRGRENLRLAVSADQGRSWRSGAVIEETPRAEYSYPTLAEDRQGRIHLTYTWRRERIRHVSFNVAWLDQRPLAQDRVNLP